MSVGVATRPTYANQPDSLGRMKECPLGQVCRNFRPRPPTPTGETVKTIPLGGGVYTYVDAADYEWLSQWTWSLSGGYASRRVGKKLIFMHREIMKPPAREEGDKEEGEAGQGRRAASDQRPGTRDEEENRGRRRR